MSASTKIVVLKLKELVITCILALLAIVLIVLLIIHITGSSKPSSGDAAQSTFTPGVYTASIMLSGTTMDLEVTVDSENVKSVRLINTAESVETMYPLLSSTILDLEEQIKELGGTYGVTYPSDAKYTSIVLLDAVNTALEKAKN